MKDVNIIYLSIMTAINVIKILHRRICTLITNMKIYKECCWKSINIAPRHFVSLANTYTKFIINISRRMICNILKDKYMCTYVIQDLFCYQLSVLCVYVLFFLSHCNAVSITVHPDGTRYLIFYFLHFDIFSVFFCSVWLLACLYTACVCVSHTHTRAHT